MKRVSVNDLQQGMVVARDLADGKGGILLRRGVALNNSHVRALEQRGFAWIYVADDASDSIVVEDMVANYVNGSCAALLLELKSVSSSTLPKNIENPADKVAEEAALEQEADGIAVIISELLNANVMTALARMVSTDQTMLTHGINVSIMALAMGMKCGLDQRSLHSLALGGLLHDCGKILLRDHIFMLPVLTEEQLTDLKRHPLLGLQMLRDLEIDDQQATLVVAQHHERQDGLGFPRALRGNNHVNPQLQSGRISLIAELIAVVDAYAMLTSQTFAKARLSAEQVASVLRMLAGTVLNRQLVDKFLSFESSIPIGASICVQSGRHIGCTGIVARHSPVMTKQPIIRLLRDGSGNWMQPLEIDLGEEPEVQLAMVLS